MGVSRYLKERKSSIKCIAVDPMGSVIYDRFHGRTINSKEYQLEGIGSEVIPGIVDFSFIDDMIRVSDRDVFIDD